MGKMRNAYKMLWDMLKRREHSVDTGVDGRIILKRVLEK
jgi:hypothetical protein